MDSFSGLWTISTFSSCLGANRGKRVRHLEPMKSRDCTKGKYQRSGNQLEKKKSVSAGQATQLPQWAVEETAWSLRELCEYFPGNSWPWTASLSSKHKIFCDQLEFPHGILKFLMLCLLGTKEIICLRFVDVVIVAAAAAVLFGWVVWFFFFFGNDDVEK